jgi:hypothetical protein
MKTRSKISIICLLPLLTLLILTPMVSCTTIGSTTFPAVVGKRYVWDWTFPSEFNGYKLGFTADSITKGIYDTHESLIVNCKVSEYFPSTGKWLIIITDEFYLAANNTLEYISFSSSFMSKAYTGPYVIPTPINLTSVAEALCPTFPIGWNYFINNNTITFNSTHARYEWTFNSGGFMTVAASKTDGVLNEQFVFEGSEGNGDIPPAIPFGIYFFIPAVSSVVALVILVKRRQLRTEEV